MLNRTPTWVVLALFLVAPSVARGAAEPGRLATAAELRQMYDAGQFQVCLQQIGRALQLRGDAAAGYDPWALKLLKADCLLRLDDVPEARRAYEAAEAAPQPKVAAEARATAYLISKSTGPTYKSRSTAETINIALPNSRKKAMLALLDDELAALRPKVGAALEATTLVPVFDVAPDLITLWAVETTATGGEAKVGPLLTGIGGRTRTLLDRELQAQASQVDAVRERANQVTESFGPSWWQSGSIRRGLFSTDRKALRDQIDYMTKLESVAAMGQRYAWQLGRDAKRWDAIGAEAAAIRAKAEQVLEAN